jgi:actin-related protein 9
MVFRDDNVVVIEMGSLLTRAVVGLAESMTPPQVRVHTRIGKKHNPEGGKTEYVFGEELDEAVATNDGGVQVIYPVVQGRIADWDAVEIFWYMTRGRVC